MMVATAAERDGAADAAGGRRKMAQTGSKGSTSEGPARAYDAGLAAKKKAAPRPEARTEFRGVSRTHGGRYGARIRHSKVQTLWLGTFDTAEEAARAYDEAAVGLHGARAVTNYKQDGVPGWASARKKPAAPRPDARTEFVGVSRQRNGKYVAGIWDPGRQKVVTVGRFDTAEEAAGAYDAAAVWMHGAAARTNFEQKPPAAAAKTNFEQQPTAAAAKTNFEQQPTAAAAKTNFEQQPTAAATDDGGEPSVDLLSDFPEPPPCDVRSDSIIPGPALDDLRTDADLTPAEWQVDEFLIDTDFADVVD